ncbi:hypothetical protein GCK32_016527, partial [Trichostrongylus colubriformis]
SRHHTGVNLHIQAYCDSTLICNTTHAEMPTEHHYETIIPLKDPPPPPGKDTETSPYENVETNIDLEKVLEDGQSDSKEELSKSAERTKRKRKPKKAIKSKEKPKEEKTKPSSAAKAKQPSKTPDSVNKMRIRQYRIIFGIVFFLWIAVSMWIVVLIANAIELIHLRVMDLVFSR